MQNTSHSLVNTLRTDYVAVHFWFDNYHHIKFRPYLCDCKMVIKQVQKSDTTPTGLITPFTEYSVQLSEIKINWCMHN